MLKCRVEVTALTSNMARSSRHAKVIFVTHDLSYTGAPLVLLDIVRCCKEELGISASLISFREGPLRTAFTCYCDDIEIFPCSLHTITSSEALTTLQNDLGTVCKELGASAVFANTLETAPAVLAAAARELPSYWYIHESYTTDYYFGHNSLAAEAAQRTLTTASELLFPCEATAALSNDCRSDGKILPYRLQKRRWSRRPWWKPRSLLRKFLGVPRCALHLLAVGTVCERKRQGDIIEALRHLPETLQRKVFLSLVGVRRELDYVGEIEKQISTLPQWLAPRVQLVAEGAAIAPYYQSADVYVLASENESAPLSLLEAMHYELPIVTTPVFGIAQLLGYPDNALYFGAGDVAYLTAQLQTLLEDEERRKQLAAASAARLLVCEAEAEVVEKLREIFKNL